MISCLEISGVSEKEDFAANDMVLGIKVLLKLVKRDKGDDNHESQDKMENNEVINMRRGFLIKVWR